MRARELYHIMDNSEFAIMDTIFFSKARAELAGLLDKVNDDADRSKSSGATSPLPC